MSLKEIIEGFEKKTETYQIDIDAERYIKSLIILAYASGRVEGIREMLLENK